MDGTLARTPLHGEHVRLGAKLVPFAGYEMPVQYPSGITAEHRAVREAAGLFDVSHMGEVVVSGPDALTLVQQATVNDASGLAVGQAQYSAMCRPDGGVIDDLLVYRFADHWMIVVNASNRAKDWDWLVAQARGLDVRLEDRSDDIALLALQGPRARQILRPLADVDVERIGYYRFVEGRVAGRHSLIAGTGYTGEDGFELYLGAADAVPVWRALLDAGASEGIAPAGLGSRDSLRLEMGYALYGNDLDEEHTPIEAGLGWITKFDKGDFVGRDALLAQKRRGVDRKLVGLKLSERGFPRPGYEVLEDGRPVGIVTSGTVSPTLGEGVAMAWVPARLAEPGTRLQVSLRGKPAAAEVVRPPFYTGGSIRRP
jgi:aminomethyltransferase